MISDTIFSLRERYFKAAQGKDSLLTLIREAEVAEHVYNSNAIENSTLTLEETEKILLQIELDRFISERELFEAKNLARVVSYIEKKAPESPLTLPLMLTLHHMLLAQIRDDIAGRFRQNQEYVRVANHIAAPPADIVPRLETMLSTYQGRSPANIIRSLAKLHLEFEHIHPFIDGNGRIGRVINNYILIREGYVPINITFIDRKHYYEAFREYDTKTTSTTMEQIIRLALTNSYHKRLAYLENKKIIPLVQYAKENKLSHSNLINKAHRQTIEAFLEKGVWKIGV